MGDRGFESSPSGGETVSHVDATDKQVGHLVTIIGRVELPIDRYRYNTVDPARDDDPFLIGLAPQHRDAFATKMTK
jgi:hypothetical protein